ncbi:MAG TPA: nucleotide pyrophosphohydrolase, partial [Patescibacteria group bacterium]|nr:nucleotide pyrophosphohydrolase [Patescibacteria group bacterium]
MSDIKELQRLVVKFRDERNWKQFHSPKDAAISLVLEASEYLELFQYKDDKEIKKFTSSNKEKISDEIADILYWILIISKDLKIDLGSSLKNKIDKNILKYPINKFKGK